MNSIQCTVYSLQFTVYSVNYTVYSLQCTVYSVYCTKYIFECTVYTGQCTVYSLKCTVYTVLFWGEDIRTVTLMVGAGGEQGAKSSLTAQICLLLKTLLTGKHVGIGRIASVSGGKYME